MTQPIQPTNVAAKSIMSGGSRYITQNVIYYGEQRIITFDTYLRRPYQASGKERVMVITKGVEFRPDLVSQKVYNFPDNWWRILEANKMKDVYEFVAGKTIILPDQVI